MLFLCTYIGFGQGFEDFSNSNATSSYQDNSFVGNNGVIWTYVHSRNENGDANNSGISGNALMLRRLSSNSRITSSLISGGIGNFSVKLYKGFTGNGNRQIELFVNNVSQGTSAPFDDFNEHIFSVNGINITGDIVIEIKNITGRQVIIDDVSWTSATVTDPNLSISGVADHGAECLNTASTITYTINNTGTLDASGINISSDNAQFVYSNLSSTTIAAGGSATFDVTFTPTLTGNQNATIQVTSSTGTSNAPTINLTGEGVAFVAQSVNTNASTNIGNDNARLNGNIIALGSCPNTIEKGFVYSQTSLDSNPNNGELNVITVPVVGLTTGNYNLDLTGLNSGTQYSYKAYVYDGTTFTYGVTETFTTTVPPANDECVNAIAINVGDPAISGNLSTATPSPILNQQPTRNDAWYSFTPNCTGDHTILATFSADIDLYVYNSNCPTSGNALYNSTSGSNTNEELTENFVAGTTYYIRVLQHSASANNFNLSVNFNDSPNNATGLEACLSSNSVSLNWNASSGTPPTGYLVFAIQGATIPFSGSPGNASSYTANTDYTAATDYGSLGRAVYKGNATNTTITGLTNGLDYTFKVVAYSCENTISWASAINSSGSWDNTYTISMPEANNLSASIATTSSVLTWTNPLPTSCYDVLIVANEGSATSFTPTLSSYAANSNYSGADSIVFFGNGITTTVTGLTDETNYCYTIFIRNQDTNEWSNGVSVCQTTGLSYCNSSGGNTTDSGILNVNLNTLDNTSASNNAYTNFTNLNTSLVLGEQYNLSVNVNTGGNYTSSVKAWIDWNRDGSFNNSTESYELGTVTNSSNSQPSSSPITITVPTNAHLGNIRMRVSSKSDNGEGYSTPCEQGSFNFGEVEDYTIIVTQPSTAEMNIKGNNITIPNGYTIGDLSISNLNQTTYGSTEVGALDGPEKIYSIENLGAAALNLNGTPRVSIIGPHASDFLVTQMPNANIGSLATSELRIQFFPSADGERFATVSIESNDSDEDPYQFQIRGIAVCSSTLTSTIWPEEGPEGTEVTITSLTNLTGAIPTINGLPMTEVSNNGSELIVLIPEDATDGNINVLFSTGCSSLNNFDVIDNIINGCDTGSSSTTLSDLFISEISDAPSGSSTFIEIFNGTGTSVNLNNYSIRIFNNGSNLPSTTANLIGTLISGERHVISVGTTSCNLSSNGLASGLPYQSFNSSGGVNFDNNSSDRIQLYNTTTGLPVDEFGMSNNTWANGLVVDGDGVNFRRKNDAPTLPQPDESQFDINDWNIIDWSACDNSNYSNFGTYDFSLGVPPIVTGISTPSFNCTTTIQISLSGVSEGVSSGQGITYQWYYLQPGQNSWQEVMDDADFDNVTSSTLDIVNAIPYDGYQFYCQVRENSQTCYTASKATKLSVPRVTWDGTNWSSPPNANTVAVLNAHYNTTTGGQETSFSCCNLIVNNGATLTIGDVLNGGSNTYVEVENNVYVYGSGAIIVQPQAAFVQINDSGTVTADNPDNIEVIKRTAPMNIATEYTYWSSPVANETIGDALIDANPGRRFRFSAENFRDSRDETDNTNTSVLGQDDIDDNGLNDYTNDGTLSDWQLVASGTIMTPGVGFASTHNPTLFNQFPCNGGPNCQFSYSFQGLFNTGLIEVEIFKNDEELNDNNWNFVGNPYPSAISADAFLNYNSDISGAPNRVMAGAIYLWSQNTAPDSNTSGNEANNFSQSDYAVINGVGQTGTSSGGGGTTPSRFIPSGQGFFIAMSNTAVNTTFHSNPTAAAGNVVKSNLVFNNSMRVRGATNNSQFFRIDQNNEEEVNRTSNEIERLWLNLSTDNGAFSQVLVAYASGATDALDSPYYDARRNASTGAFTILYSTIENSNQKFAIQGKDPSSLNLNEVIPLGFATSINEATLYEISIAQIEGSFLDNTSVYLKDTLLNIVHNLSNNPYTFTSETGEFNNRFEIVFQEDTLAIRENELDNSGLSIIELSNGLVRFTVPSNFEMESIEIIDLLGRSIYLFNANSSEEIYNLSNLSTSTYIAKVTLTNGQIINKKAIKQ